MRICVLGAGAVGGYLAVRLLQTGGHEVSVIARGAHLKAIAERGLTLWTDDSSVTVRPHAATARAADLPAQDLVFVTTKAHAQPAAAHDIAKLLGATGAAVFMANGIPWWWPYHGMPGAQPLPLLDPDAALWTQVRPERAIGCVVYSANEVVQPGVVRHSANNHWLLGEPDERRTPRLASAVALLRQAGLHAEASADLRHAIWTKLLRNAPLNAVCALTRLPVEGLADDASLVALCHAVIDEVIATAQAHGADVSAQRAEARAAPERGGALGGRAAVAIRPSMLQDVLAGRSLEVEPILGQLQRFARDAGVATPTVDRLLPLLRGLARSEGLA